MKRDVNLIVTDGNYKHSLGIIRALGKEGIKPFVLSNKANSLCGLSKYSRGEVVLPVDVEYEELLKSFLLYEISLIILVGTNSFKKFIPWKRLLKQHGIEMVTVDLPTQEIAFSKVETYKQAARVGVPIPKTFYPESFSELEFFSKQVSYPCVIKGLFEVGGNIVDYANDSKDLILKYNKICKKYDLKEGVNLPMLQEYISGFGCAFFAVYNDGDCGPTFQHKRIREYPVSGGASVCAESYKNPLVEKYGKKLLDSLNWNGVAMVEFKMNANNEPVLMEINPKFWGSTDLALEAGVNFPKYLVEIYQGEKLKYSSKYKFPFRYHWPLDGDIQHGIENPKNIFLIIKDILNPRVRSNLWVTDPKPIIKQLLGFLKGLIGTYIWRK